MGLDSALVTVGEFGRYQRKIFILLCLVGFPKAIFDNGSIFWMQTPDFTCTDKDGENHIAEAKEIGQTYGNDSESAAKHVEAGRSEHFTRHKYWNYLWQSPKLSPCYLSTHEDNMQGNNYSVELTNSGTGLQGVDSEADHPGLKNGSCPHVTFQTKDVTFVTVVTRVSG